MRLEDISIHAWIQEHGIRTEKGTPIDFNNHLFLFDPYTDFSEKQVVLKAAQIGFSTLAINKTFYIAKKFGIDIIYTLPTDSDVGKFVSGKVNRFIANNPILQSYTKDKDTIEQKKVGMGMIYYNGTFTKRAAISVTADVLVHDELDFSDQEIIGDYESRLQHSDYRWIWYFGHPSTEGIGVAKIWDKSDQKHWFINCNHCGKAQYMSWPESICKERKIYQCKKCSKELSDQARKQGRWVKKYKDREISGYWIPLFLAPWISAKHILYKYDNSSAEFFYNRVLGLPYVGGGNKVSQYTILGNLTEEFNKQEGRVVIGVDTGAYLRYVIGNAEGIFHYGECKDQVDGKGEVLVSKYDKIEQLLNRYSNGIVIFDQGGEPSDSLKVRELAEKYPARVFLCFYREDRKSMEIVKWDDEKNTVVVDRNRSIQLLIDEFADRRIPLFGSETDWWDYWRHWSHIYRMSEETPLGTKRYKWLRSGRDDWVHATVYWRVGMSRFSQGENEIFMPNEQEVPIAPEILPGQQIKHDPLVTTKKLNWNI